MNIRVLIKILKNIQNAGVGIDRVFFVSVVRMSKNYVI